MVDTLLIKGNDSDPSISLGEENTVQLLWLCWVRRNDCVEYLSTTWSLPDMLDYNLYQSLERSLNYNSQNLQTLSLIHI